MKELRESMRYWNYLRKEEKKEEERKMNWACESILDILDERIEDDAVLISLGNY